MKYKSVEILFSEVPDEVSLGISISGCPNQCPDCHSKFLWEDEGFLINENVLDNLILRHSGITCICILGGDQDPNYIKNLCKYIKGQHSNLKVCWYSGKTKLADDSILQYLDYLKLGPFRKECGPLTDEHTNQKFFFVINGALEDKSHLFLRRSRNS